MSFESPDIDTGEDDRKRDSSRKRDGKREKRDKGYQMFEEDSDDEPLALAEDLKSPSKQKKERMKPSFKFPVSVRKEKTKEKEDKKEKEAKHEEKEKKKEEKEKKKHKKDKKKSKHAHKEAAPAIVAPDVTENPIFGVPLALAVARNKSHDGIELPALVRECIDYIEEYGLACEGIYRMSGVKSKVQHLKEEYNRGESPHLLEHEPNVVASLLKLFLRELPEPVLTTQLLPKFEEASIIKLNKKKVETFTRLIADLPTCNRLLLSWMIVHMTHVIELAKENKMSLQNVSIVLSPTMQISHRVLNVLFSNASELFGDVQLRRYVPPLKPAHSKWSLELPDNLMALEEELAKQESLLNQLHAELHSGREDPNMSEQLWEVQRVVTQLKRKIKMGKKNVELAERRKANIDAKRLSNTSLPSLSAPEELHLDLRPAPTVVTTTVEVEEHATKEAPKPDKDKTSDVPPEGEKSGEAAKVTTNVEEETASKPATEKTEEDKAKDCSGDAPQGAESDGKKVLETKKGVKFAPEAPGKVVKETTADEKEKEEKKEETAQGDDGKVVEEERVQGSVEVCAESAEEIDKVEEKQVHKAEAGEIEGQQTSGVAEVDKRQSSEAQSPDSKGRNSVECKESEGVKTLEKGKPEGSKVTFAREDSVTVEEGPQIVEGPPTPTATTTTDIPSEPTTEQAEAPQVKDTTKKVKFATVEDDQSASKVVEENEANAPPKAEEHPAEAIEESQPVKVLPVPSKEPTPPVQDKTKPVKKAYEYRKAPNPPFVSTSLLKPMKAEPPKPRQPSVPEDEGSSPQQESEKWRELEEELLGQGRDEEEEAEIERLLEEEYALQLETEELLAIGDELRQKLATEHSEMERLTQEIQELQFLRQDSDLEDLSSASSSSSDSEDEDDLQDLLVQLIQENEELEAQSADMSQKIHEERMICLSVKLQIRLLQQKQLESSCS